MFRVLAGVDPFQPVVAAHDRARPPLFHGDLERQEVSLAQGRGIDGPS